MTDRTKALQAALVQATSYFDALYDDDDFDGYAEHLDAVISNALGHHVGLNADWVNEAWPLRDGLFLFAEDDDFDFSIVRERFVGDERFVEEVTRDDGRPAYATGPRGLAELLGAL